MNHKRMLIAALDAGYNKYRCPKCKEEPLPCEGCTYDTLQAATGWPRSFIRKRRDRRRNRK